MIAQSSKFLWPDLTKYLLTQVDDDRLRMIKFLSILDINYDPAPEMPLLSEIICCRPQLFKALLAIKEVKLSPKSMLHILTKLSNLSNVLALECLNGPQEEWDKLADKFSSKGGTIVTKSIDDIRKLYDDQVKDAIKPPPFEEFVKLSQLAESRSKVYKHDLYQAAIAGIIIAQNKPFTLAQVPTGSGKSYIIAMLALHYHQALKAEILILVSNETLRKQLFE